jgi:hypothetical protein
MASPFHVFRKHQRAMLVVVGILCMIGFSIAGAIDYSDRSRTTEDPVIATAYGKSIHGSEVQQLLRRRSLAINFMAECLAAGQNFPGLAQMYAQQVEQYFGPATEEAVVQTWVLGERARRMGVVISDAAINKYLRRVTRDKVKPQVFSDIVNRLGVGQPQVFDALRGELLARRLQDMALGGPRTTPAQRWDYYRRQKQRATVEVAALPVEKFIDEVPDAPTEELQAFFDAHKDREPDPESPTPGFKVPKKAAFQVVLAEFAKFYDESAVTDEEIQKQYDDFKDTRYLWDQYALEGEDDEPEEPATEDDKPAASNEKADDEKSPDEKAPDEKAPADDKSDDSSAKPDEKSQSSRVSPGALVPKGRRSLAVGASPRARMQSASSAAQRRQTAPPTTPPPLRGLSSRAPDNRGLAPTAKLRGRYAAETIQPGHRLGSAPATANFSLAAACNIFVQPWSLLAGLVAADEENIADKKDSATETKTPAEPPPEKAASETKPSGEKPADLKKADKKAKSTKLPAIAPQITDELVLPRDIRKGSHPKHAPLWKVEKTIRKELAREKANKKLDEALQVVREKMRKYSRRLGAEETESKMPDLDKVAEAQGLTEYETGLLSALDFREKHPDLAQARGDQSSAEFLVIAYISMPKFQSTTVQDIEANRYLVWKTEEEDAYVPEFADVRSKVLRAWKMTKARDLAIKKAKELAEKANKAAQPLKAVFADREGLTVAQTPAFSWLTRGTANADNRAPLRLSAVEGVESPGADFMHEVFSLGVGSVGEAMNQPQTVAYVVRVVHLDPPRELLRNGFLADPFALYNEVAQDDMAEVAQAWLKGIEAESNLTWKDSEAERRRR